MGLRRGSTQSGSEAPSSPRSPHSRKCHVMRESVRTTVRRDSKCCDVVLCCGGEQHSTEPVWIAARGAVSRLDICFFVDFLSRPCPRRLTVPSCSSALALLFRMCYMPLI